MMDMTERIARALAHCDGSRITGPTRHKASDEFGWDANHRYMQRYIDKHWPEFAHAASFALSAMTRGEAAVVDVVQERRRQVESEGWTPEHDDGHGAGVLAKAAVAYACDAAVNLDEIARGRPGEEFAVNQTAEGPPPIWPWSQEWWKPSPGNPRRDLVKAAALLLAEIERLDRAPDGSIPWPAAMF